MTTTTDPVRFGDIQSSHPDLEAISEITGQLCTRLNEATAVDDCIALIGEWDALRAELSTHDALVDLRFNQDTNDAERKAARELWDKTSPRWTELQVDVKRTLLSHPLRSEIEQKIGAQAFALWESNALSFDSAIKDDLARELELGATFTEMLAGAELEYGGEKLNLSSIVKHRQSADRQVRHDAEQVLWNWFSENAEQLDENFDQQVQLRDGMALKLGLRDFVDLGYKRMCRVDYDRKDVERFRAEIISKVVPLAAELSARQAKTLGVHPLMAWDEHVHDPAGNPLPKGDREWMVGQAQSMFDEMDGDLSDFFKRMDTGGFLDLDVRKGKAGGGFCTAFETKGMPFVYANFNGTKDDVDVLTHEIGHAFQFYSSRNQKPTDYCWPTYESAEVHSMSLEFLTGPYMDKFFGEDGERYRMTHLTQAFLFLPYGTAVDHFQHLIYENPTATPAERHEMWLEMERTYLPWRNWGDLDYPAKGGRWQHQRHIYLSPFYYIDYVLAQTCALQFWAMAAIDRQETLDAYVELCGRGGSLPFQALVRSAGLTSPFDAGCLSDVVSLARKVLRV